MKRAVLIILMWVCAAQSQTVDVVYDSARLRWTGGPTNWLASYDAGAAWTPLELSPLMWLRADGSAVDASGNGYNGTWIGSEAYTAGVNGSAFVIGSSLSGLSTLAASAFPSNAGTICGWFRPDWTAGASSGSRHFWDTYGGNNRRMICWSQSAAWSIYTDSTTRGPVSYGTMQSNIWTHVAFIWGENKLYTNGVLATDRADGGLGLGASTLYVGNRYTWFDYAFRGAIDDVMVFSRAITTNELALLVSWRQ